MGLYGSSGARDLLMQSRDTASVTVTSRRLMTVNGNVVRRVRVCYKTLCLRVTMNKNSVPIVTKKMYFCLKLMN